MGAPYLGFYSHLFSPSSQNGNYKGKSKKAIKLFQHIVREDNNMAGIDVNLNPITLNIHSPVPLEKQKNRDVFSKYGIMGPVYGA